MDQIERFVDQYVEALRDDNAAIFAGAGLSIPAGLVDWTALMKDIAADIGLSVDKEIDLLSVAQFHVNERGGRHRINQALINEFAERSEQTENHRILSSLPIKTYWTTNYDTLLEDALRGARKRVDVKVSEETLATTLPRRDAIVFKMHGDISRVDTAVVTRDDYEAYSAKYPLFGTALQGDLVSKTFLFIGFSFNDPNLWYLLSRIRLLLGQNRRDHYCLLRRVQRDDFDSQEEYDYARARQDLQVRDLKRYGIHGLLVDSYSEYTSVLRRIASRYLRRRIFISGSATTYGPWSDDQGQEFARQLGFGLIQAGLDVVTGFGLGIGPYFLNGVMEGLNLDGTSTLHDRVTLRPFPQGVRDPDMRAKRWYEYRQDMISQAGIAVFLFGNRSQGNEVEVAPGVLEEFEIAAEAGVAIIPLGATGYAAKEIHKKVMQDFDNYYLNQGELRAFFERLDMETDPNRLIDIVLKIISVLARG